MSTPRKFLRSLTGIFFLLLGILEILLPRIINLALGGFFVTLGVAGVILPIVNGTFFLIIGLVLISFESNYVKKKLHILTSKNKVIHKWHLYLEGVLRKYFVRKEKPHKEAEEGLQIS